MRTIDYALCYLSAGISVMPIRCDGSKAPQKDLLPEYFDEDEGKFTRGWNPLRDERANDIVARGWWECQCPPGIAAICGAGSAGLEVIDFDQQADILFPKWRKMVAEAMPGIFDRLCIVQTPREPAGYHVWLRCGDIVTPGNDKLAVDPSKKGKDRTLIETRGEGGYALVPGCPPACHETGRLYIHQSGPTLWQMGDVSMDERELLLDLARSFNLEAQVPVKAPAPTRNGTDLRPGDDFDLRGPDWEDILCPHGWTMESSCGGERRWRRPGKKIGWGATTGHCKGPKGEELLHVFTTSAHPLEEGNYGKFRAWAILNHGGDCSAAARELVTKGYGTPRPSAAKTHDKAQSEEEKAEEPADDGSTTATLADVAVHLARMEWTWTGWIQRGVVVALASEPGVGKTRLCLDIIRRIRHGLPWPDGAGMTLTWDTPIIYLPCDHQHAEMIQGCRDFGIDPGTILLNAPKSDPFAGIDLDLISTQRLLSARIAALRPALVIVDTVGNATETNLCRAEEARKFFGYMMGLALQHQTSIVLVTHLNASGGTLGRRLDGSARQVIKMECPDPENQPTRRRLWVSKSNSKYPPPLGVTMGDRGNEYDTKPPTPPEEGPGGQPDSKLREVCDWLKDRLSEEPCRVPTLRDEAEKCGYSASTLYRAKARLDVEEFTRESVRGKWWRLSEESEQSGSHEPHEKTT